MPKRNSESPLPDELTTLPARIEYARGRRKMSKAALAKRAGMDPTAIVRLESGERLVGLEVRTLLRLARALEVPVGWLAADEGEPGPVAVFTECMDGRLREAKRRKRTPNKGGGSTNDS